MSNISLGTLIADNVNLVGRDQVNYHLYPPSTPGSENANRQLQRINDAPIDLLSAHFTGREKELEFVNEALNKHPTNLPSRCAIHGMPGLGKTQLLLKYATLAFENNLYSHIFWTSATTVDKLNQGFAKILDLVDDHSRYLQDQNAKLTLARRWLEEPRGSDIDWLLVVDNVHPEALSFLRSHLPRSNVRGSILFTTRTADVANALTNAAGVQYPILALQTLDLTEATNLLVGDAGFDPEITSPSQTSQAEALVKCVGRLPLAVVHAASFIKQTGTTLDDMLKLYDSGQKMKVIQWENNLNTYEERSVAATFSNLFNQLDDESRDISHLLKVLSFLDPENIPVKMIVEGARRLSNSESPDPFADPLPASPIPSTSSSLSPPPLSKPTPLRRLKEWGERHWPLHRAIKTDINHTRPTSPIHLESSSLISLILSPIEFQKAIQKLNNLSLVEHRPNIGDSSLWMHDLVQFMIQESARTEETHRKWLQLSVSLVCFAFQHIDCESSQSWPEFQKFVPHLWSLNEAWDDMYGFNEELTVAKINTAKYLWRCGRYDEAEVLYKQVVEATKKHLGVDHPYTLTSMNDLAWVYDSQGRYDDAETLNKQVLAIKQKLLEADHPDTLTSMNNLAWVYQSQGRYDDAETLIKQVLASKQKLQGVDHPDILPSMDNLASVYDSQGRYDDAETLIKQTLTIKQKLLEADHPSTLTSMNNLATVYESQGRYDDAETLIKQVLASRQKLREADHPETLTSMNNLAWVYQSQGRFDDAESLHKQVLASRQKLLGADYPVTLSSMNNLALVYHSKGRYDDAEALHKQALSSRQKLLGPDHPRTLSSMNNLALVYHSKGRYYDAEMLNKQVLASRQKLLRADHPDTLTSMNNLALVYQSQGRFDDAETLHKQVLASRQKLLQADHPDTLTSINNLALVYHSKGRYDDAETLNKQVLAGRQKLLGADHPSTLASMNDLAFVYESQGRSNEAAALYKVVLAGREKCFGSGHPHTRETVCKLARLCQLQGQDIEGDASKEEKPRGNDRPAIN